MAKKEEEIDRLLSGIDFKNLTTEEITGPDGLIKTLIKRVVEQAMNAQRVCGGCGRSSGTSTMLSDQGSV